MKTRLHNGFSTISFDRTPPAFVRNTVKQFGYRWSPSGRYWYRRANATEHAAAVASVEATMRGELPHSTPVVSATDFSDLLYEDQCAQTCGL